MKQNKKKLADAEFIFYENKDDEGNIKYKVDSFANEKAKVLPSNNQRILYHGRLELTEEEVFDPKSNGLYEKDINIKQMVAGQKQTGNDSKSYEQPRQNDNKYQWSKEGNDDSFKTWTKNIVDKLIDKTNKHDSQMIWAYVIGAVGCAIGIGAYVLTIMLN